MKGTWTKANCRVGASQHWTSIFLDSLISCTSIDILSQECSQTSHGGVNFSNFRHWLTRFPVLTRLRLHLHGIHRLYQRIINMYCYINLKIPPCAVAALLKCSKGCTLSHCICFSLHINVTSIYKGWQPQTTKMHSTYKETNRKTMTWKSLDKTRKSITGFRVREHLPTVNWLFLCRSEQTRRWDWLLQHYSLHALC